MAFATDFVTSADGTRIGFERTGRGPPLVLVHGVMNSAASWRNAAAALAPDFNCFVVDRRGRGLSGDGARHSIDREADDIAAVLDAAGPQALLFAHSFGAACALKLALRRPMPGMIVYEPPLDVRAAAQEIAPVLDRALAARGTNPVLRGMLQRVAANPDTALKLLGASRVLASIAGISPIAAREAGALLREPVDLAALAAIRTPTLVLAGSDSPAWLRDSAGAVAQALPDARLEILAGQGHAAQRTAPALLARHVAAFARRLGEAQPISTSSMPSDT